MENSVAKKEEHRKQLNFQEVDRASDFLADALTNIQTAYDYNIDESIGSNIKAALDNVEKAQRILLRGTEHNKLEKVGDPLPEVNAEWAHPLNAATP